MNAEKIGNVLTTITYAGPITSTIISITYIITQYEQYNRNVVASVVIIVPKQWTALISL